MFLKCVQIPIDDIIFLFSQFSKKKESSSHAEKKSKKHQGSKFPATDGVSLEYFLSEISDDDSTSW